MKAINLILMSVFCMSMCGATEYTLFPQGNETAKTRFVQEMQSGVPVSWDSSQPITLSFAPQVPDPAKLAVIEAFETWNNQIGNQLIFNVVDSNGAISILWDLTTNGNGNTEIIAITGYHATDSHLTSVSIVFYAGVYDFHKGFPYGASFNAVTSRGVADLNSVALHECGHALGLSHSMVLDSEGLPPVMYPFLGTASYYLHDDDIAGIQHLYSNPSSLETEQDQMTAFYTQLGVAYVLNLNFSPRNPRALRGKIVNSIVVGRTTFFFDSVTKKFIGLLSGSKFTLNVH